MCHCTMYEENVIIVKYMLEEKRLRTNELCHRGPMDFERGELLYYTYHVGFNCCAFKIFYFLLPAQPNVWA